MDLKLEDLKEWELNPREQSSFSFDGLKTSLKEYGDISGITFNIRNKRLATGHHRIRALKEEFGDNLKLKGPIIKEVDNVKEIFYELYSPKGVFNIRIIDADDNTHAAINVSANNQYISGQYTNELQPILDGLKIEIGSLFDKLNLNKLELSLGDISDINFEESQDIETKYNFIIKCNNLKDMEFLKNYFLTSGEKIEFEHFNSVILEKTKSFFENKK